MPHVKGTIPNLINGISQQAASLRLPSQAEVCENNYPVIVDGLVQRPRTDHLADLGVNLPSGSFVHTILRDESEKYILAITPEGVVRVWDFEGDEKTVTNSGAGYLTGVTDPENQLRALTVADHTFIVNKSKVVAAGSATSPTRPHEALIDVLAGNYARTYRIIVNGGLAAEYRTPDGGAADQGPYIDTIQIASYLYTGLVTPTGQTGLAGGGFYSGAGGLNEAPWALGRYHSTLYLRNSSVDFTIAVEDGYSGRAMKEAKNQVSQFSDLPQHGPDGVVMKVAGTEGKRDGEYWVQFEKTNPANGFGIWKECVAPGAKLGLDAGSMPHTLRRNEDGTFTFGPGTWDNRECGDVDKNPDPSFVGHTIQDVFYHRNRLGFLTSENYVLSEAGGYFNFYRTSLITLLDTDPIDGAASHIKVSLLRHAVPYSEIMLLFSDNTQFRLDGNELLTPKTVNAKPLSELSANPRIRPVVCGTNLYFMAEGTEWASLYEYFLDKQIQSADEENVSAHAPGYVPAGIRRVIASPESDLVLVTTSGDPNAIYLYKFHWNGQEKVQSAWARWSFPHCSEILDIEFDKKTVIATMRRGSTTCIERLNVEAGVKDPGLPYITYLDRSVVLGGAHANYVDGETIFTLPYAILEGVALKAVTAPGGQTVPGVELDIAWIEGNQVAFTGNYILEMIRFGTEFESRFRFSPFNYRGLDGKQPVQDGHLQILTLSLLYARSAYFRLEVTPQRRPKRSYAWASTIVGEAVTGAINLASGRVSVPIMSRNDRVIIDIVNDTWRPSSFIGAEWRGTFNPASREK